MSGPGPEPSGAEGGETEKTAGGGTLGGLHRPADGDDHADAGRAAGGIARLCASADRVAADGERADGAGHRRALRRRRRDQRLGGHDAARKAVRPDPGADADDVLERRQLLADHAAVQPQPLGRRRRAGRAGGDQRGRGLPAQRHDPAAGLPQDQSGRDAGADPGPHLRHAAADDGRRLRREHPDAAPVASLGRRPRHHRRAAAAGDAHRGQPGAARGARPHPGGCAQRGHGRHRRRRQGRAARAAAGLRARGQRPALPHPRLRRSRGGLSRWRAGAAARCRACRDRAGQQPAGRLVRPAAGGGAERAAEPRRQRHRHGRPDQGRAAAADGLAAARHQALDRFRPHPDHPRLGRRCPLHADADRRHWW